MILHILVFGLKYKCQFVCFVMFNHNFYFMYVQIQNYQSHNPYVLLAEATSTFTNTHFNEPWMSIAAVSPSDVTIWQYVTSCPRAAYLCVSAGLPIEVVRTESREQRVETTGTIQIQPQPPQYGSCPRVRIICTKFQWYLAPKLGYSVWTSAEMWHNLIKSKLSINWKSQKLARTGNKLTCKTLLRLPSLDWRLTGTVSGVRAVSPVCQENSKTKSILLYLGLTVLPILHSPLNQ